MSGPESGPRPRGDANPYGTPSSSLPWPTEGPYPGGECQRSTAYVPRPPATYAGTPAQDSTAGPPAWGRNSLAGISMISGIVALLLGMANGIGYSLVLAPGPLAGIGFLRVALGVEGGMVMLIGSVAFIMGVVGHHQTFRSGGRERGSRRALTGIISGIIVWTLGSITMFFELGRLVAGS